MAKYVCSISGLQLSTEHTSVAINSLKGAKHPIFYLSQKELMSIARELPRMQPVEKYLYFLSLMNSTELVLWKTACYISNNTHAVISNNTERLLKMVGSINIIQHPSFRVPKLSINRGNNQLQSVSGWLDGMEEAFHEWYTNYKTTGYTQKLIRRKAALEYIIKDSTRDPVKFSIILAEWAEMAGSFSTSQFYDPEIKGYKRLNDYWKEIIISCTTSSAVFRIPKKDIEELIEHCEDNMEAGNIYYHALMQHLHSGLKKQSDFLGLGEMDLPNASNSFRILQPENSIEDANRAAMIAAAPNTAPIRSNYPTLISYLRAKARYDMAQEYKDKEENIEQIDTVASITLSTSIGDI